MSEPDRATLRAGGVFEVTLELPPDMPVAVGDEVLVHGNDTPGQGVYVRIERPSEGNEWRGHLVFR